MDNLTATLSAVGTLSATLTPAQTLTASLSSDIYIKTQTKTVTPTQEAQTIVADAGYAGLSAVTVNAIPSDYGHIVYNGSYILVE